MAPKAKPDDKLTQFWFPHSAEGYVLGEVLHVDPNDNMHVRLQLHDGEKTANFHVSVAKPVNPTILDGVNDNTQLMHLHEPSLLFNLRHRYSKDLVYTYTGAAHAYAPWTCILQTISTHKTTMLLQVIFLLP